MLTSTPEVLLRVCDSSSGWRSMPLAAPSEGSSACLSLSVRVRCTSVYACACDLGARVPWPLPAAQRADGIWVLGCAGVGIARVMQCSFDVEVLHRMNHHTG